jgi:hypothetical protein
MNRLRNIMKKAWLSVKNIGDNKVIAVSLNNLAYIANYQGDYAAGQEILLKTAWSMEKKSETRM